jgi:putative glutamine amidotransferase
MERNGFTFFENALQRGDLENIKLMKEKGAHTHRPIIAVTTDARGWAFRGGARAVEKRGAIALPLAVPFTAYMKAKDFRAFAQNPRGMLTSGNSEVEAIVDHVRSVFKIADAIWISGGDHVWEFWYKNATVVHPRVLERDVLEMAVLYLQEQEVYKPVIGVCRGMQLANVFHGGSLREKEEFGPTQIWVTKQDGLLGKNFPDGATGHSMHHQSLDTVAEILQPVAESAIGVVEAVQSKNRELPLIGTQYHPEFTAESDLMRNYIMDLIFDMAEAAKHQTCLNDNNVRDAHFSKSHKSGFLSYLSE